MTLSRSTLAHCFFRSLFLQAAWNRRGMQNLGFAYAVDPALRALYAGDPERRRAAMERHLGFFNCHPYTAAAILGGALHHEEKVAAGQERPREVEIYKSTLQGPLAAIGDGFFWTALRPFVGALAALGALAIGWPGVVLALTLYNAIHLSLRMTLFRAGYRQGDAVIGDIARLGLPAAAARLRVAAAALCGLCAALLGARSGVVPHSAGILFAVLGAAGGHLALSRGARLLPAAYAAMAAGTATALAASRLHGRF